MTNIQPQHMTLAVLAGGAGSRMGAPKVTLTISGAPILQYLIDRLRWPGPTLLVTAPGREHPPGADRFDREVVDPVSDEGPLRGVATALEHSTSGITIIAAVDMPLIDRDMLELLVRSLDARPQSAGVMFERSDPTRPSEQIVEPLPCAVRSALRTTIQERLAQGRRSLHGLVDGAVIDRVPAPIQFDPGIWTNLNNPADLESFRTIAPDPRY